jgi:DNA-binding SARP family transcriptional activator/tetratricopeptide (TPR) repeat protein
VLGPVRAWRGDTELNLGPPMQRALLAILLAQAGQPVAVHEILDILWDQNPPNSAVNVVHRHIGALRRLFEPELPTRATSRWLVRSSGGYRLDIQPETLDLLQFRELCRRAGRLAEDGQPGPATELLLEALGLWHGLTATGIAAQVRSHPVFSSVDREHLFAIKLAADYALGAEPGFAERVLITLRTAALEHPLDEVLQARLIVILAATGHQAEALEVYQAVRGQLADDLGLDPGPELHAAQQQVLSQASSVGLAEVIRPAAPVPPSLPGFTPAMRPAQLPADLAVFTGRRQELAQYDALLPEDGDQPTTAIGTIGGMAGIGKTALAVHWAHRVAHRFPDGQLYVNLRGFHPSGAIMRAGEALRSFLDAFGVPAHSIPADLDAQASLYRSLLADRRVLIVLDNARDTEQVRHLLPGAPGSLTVVTSRNPLYDLVAGEGAHSLTLELLSTAEALEFLSRRLGADRVTLELRAAREIVRLCGWLPLTLAIVSARAAVNPRFSLDSIAAELRQSHGSLDAFTGEGPSTDARSVFSWSYHTLTPEAARLFRLLALHPGPECSVAAAAGLAGRPTGEMRSLLAELLRAHLIFEAAPGRFGGYELLRTYASELSQQPEFTADSAQARLRLFDYYLHSLHAADHALAPSRERISLEPPAPEVEPQHFADQSQAADWLDAERPVLLAAIEQDAVRGSGQYSWQLASLLELYLDRMGRWQEQLAIQRTAATAAQRLGDQRGQAHAHRALGFVCGRLELRDQADTHLLQALALFGQVGDRDGQGRVHRYLAFLANQRGRHHEALHQYRLANNLYRLSGRLSGQASIYNEVGWTYILLHEYGKALDECRMALALHQAIGDRNGEAAAWDSLGYAQLHRAEYGQALVAFGQALELYRAIRDQYLEADTLVHIGDTHQAAGSLDPAVTAWRQALEILDEIGHPDAESVRAQLRAVSAGHGGRQSFVTVSAEASA